MITMENYEGWLMRYADGALTRDEREAVEAFLSLHPELREEMEEVVAVKVTPVMATLPGKESMLHKEESAFTWWRVAAAVVLLAVVGTTLLVINRKPIEGGPMIAKESGSRATERIDLIDTIEAIEEIEAIEGIDSASIRSILPVNSIATIPSIPSIKESPLLAEEAASLPQTQPEETPLVDNRIIPISLPEPTVTVAPVIENARLAVNPWLEVLTASK